MNDPVPRSMEEAKRDFEKIFQRYTRVKHGSCSEKDTLTKFIHPTLMVLGWDVLDPVDMQEEVLVKPEGRDNHIDIVLYLECKPYIGIEAKALSYGRILDESGRAIKDSVTHLREGLLRKSRQLNVRYAVLTRFAETLIFDPTKGTPSAIFDTAFAHFERFHTLWTFLSKPIARS